MKEAKREVSPFEMPIISKEEAKEKGLTRYFTGIPCDRKKHISQRLVSNGGCCKCARESENRRRRGEKLDIVERKCKSDKCNIKIKIPSGSHQVYCSAKCRSYFTSKLQRTLSPERTRAANNKCFEKYGAKYNFKRSGKRELIKTHLTKEEEERGIAIFQKMLDMNKEANPGNRKKRKYVVDHRIPLSMGGRHHPNNFQIITMAENSYKNRFIEKPDFNDPEYKIAYWRYNLGIFNKNV